jgi:hypothetical protein
MALGWFCWLQASSWFYSPCMTAPGTHSKASAICVFTWARAPATCFARPMHSACMLHACPLSDHSVLTCTALACCMHAACQITPRFGAQRA